MRKSKNKRFFDLAEKSLGKKTVASAREAAQKEIIAIRLQQKLAELRERSGTRQNEVDGFTQSNVSRLEKREDMRLSTLARFLKALGFHLQIKAISSKKGKSPEEFILLTA